MVFYDRFKWMHSMAERSVSGSLYQMLVVALGIGLPGREVYSQAFANYELSVSVSHRALGTLLSGWRLSLTTSPPRRRRYGWQPRTCLAVA